ncbi:MAG: S1 family peptidase [Alphaproteobacteria bacterium]|jgi:serine protease Do
MRRLDWMLMIIVFAVSIGLRMLTGEAPASDNPRRPSAERFTPEKQSAGVWDRETWDWLTARPTPMNNGGPGGLPREGIVKEDHKPGDTSGTAFSVSAKGYWLTARHVAEGCKTISIQVRERSVIKVNRTILHPRADVAMLITKRAPAPLVVATAVGAQDAFNVGFPAGQPGAVHTRYMGEMTLRHKGGRIRGGGYREVVNAWSEQSRVPALAGSLGGISGGVVLDGSGQVIGVVQAESRRRGRVMTAQTKTLREMFNHAKFTPVSSGETSERSALEGNLTGDTYPTTARNLILSRRVAKVLCHS